MAPLARSLWPLPLALLVGCGLLAEPQPPPTAELEGKLDRWMERHRVDRASLVANRCGEPWLEIRRDAPDGDAFALASSSKWLGAVAILAAADRGIVDLDAPLSTWLPELEPPRDAATLRQVLGHRSGYVGLLNCMGSPTHTLQECAAIADRTVGYPPGTRFHYANAGLIVAGAAVEKAAGKPFVEVFDEVLAQPMGWEHTTYGEAGAAGNPNLAFGLESTAEEYLAFLQMLLDGGMGPNGRVLSEARLAEMWVGEDLPRTGFVPPSLRHTTWPVYGLGAWLEEHDDNGVPGVASAQGRYGFQPWIDRRQRVAAVFAVQLGGPGHPDARSSPGVVPHEVAALADALAPCSR